MKSLLPSHIAVVEQSCDKHYALQYEEEKHQLGEVLDKRYQEFACGRDCAHKALAQLSAPDQALLMGENKEPLWPDNYTGSITHCHDYCAAAVANANEVAAVGIDAEINKQLSTEMRELIAFDDEQQWINTHSNIPYDVLIFSAKESVFKAWYPITQQWLEFEDIRIRFNPANESFRVNILKPDSDTYGLPHENLIGNYCVTPKMVMTSVYVDLT